MIQPILLSMLASIGPYDAVDLGCISDGQCWGWAINDEGQVAGYGNAPNGMSYHGLFWNGTSLEHIVPLNYPAGGQVWAYGVNNLSQVVGYSSAGGLAIHAYVWENGMMTDLGSPGWATADFSRAEDISDNGWIVGFAGGVPDGLRGFILHDDEWTEIPTFGGDESRAYAVNELGDVVGYARNPEGKLRAYGIPSGDVSQMLDLGDLGGGAAQAFGVNNHRQVVGQSKTVDEFQHAFLWTQEAGMIDLGTLGGDNSWAWAINDEGVVVGKAELADGSTHGFAWKDGTMHDLATLLIPDVDVTIVNARDISASGLVAATGAYPDGRKRPYLLTPENPGNPADVNGDGVVNVDDLLIVIAAWGPCDGCPADIDGDLVVGVNDLLAVIAAWG